MASEASAGFADRHRAAGGIAQTGRRSGRRAGSNVESVHLGEEADAAFEKFAGLLEDKGLAHVGGAERPEQIDGSGSVAIDDGKGAFVGSCGELIEEGAALKGQLRMDAQIS
jgi:hypothetical protein